MLPNHIKNKAFALCGVWSSEKTIICIRYRLKPKLEGARLATRGCWRSTFLVSPPSTQGMHWRINELEHQRTTAQTHRERLQGFHATRT